MGRVLTEPYAQLYDEFLQWIQNRVTVQGYESIRTTVYYLLKWFEEEEIIPQEATVRDAQRYKSDVSNMTGRHGKPFSSGTIHNRLKAGKTLFKYLLITEKVKTNLFMEIKPPRHSDKLSRNVLSEVQMGYLLESLRKFDEPATSLARIGRYRLHVLCEFLYATGLRIAEAASLIPENIDTKSRLVYIPEGKGKKSRTAFMTGYACEVMSLYLKRGRKAVFASHDRKCGGTVFGAAHDRLSFVVSEGLKTLCAELNLPRITSHAFRYSLGTHLLRAGCDMRYIQVILGHEDLKTTQIYTRVNKDDVKDSLDRFHPRKWGNAIPEA